MSTLEYREMTAPGRSRWIKRTAELISRQETSGFVLYVMFEDIDAKKRAELAIKERAETDPLTGVLNRKTFRERMSASLTEAGASGTLGALFMLDLDSFKRVNDSFGHAKGDQLLIEVGRTLRSTLRKDDLVSRIGGDEFMIYLSNVTSRDVIAKRAEHICFLLRRSFSADIRLSASVGVAVCPDNGTDFDTLYLKADTALYNVKSTTKDGFAFHTDDMEMTPISGGMAQRNACPPAADGPSTGVSSTDVPASGSPAFSASHPPKPRLLLVSADTVERDIIGAELGHGYVCDYASDSNSAIIKLRRFGMGISAVLIDLDDGEDGADGFAMLARAHTHADLRLIPFIAICAEDDS